MPTTASGMTGIGRRRVLAPDAPVELGELVADSGSVTVA
jgi:hypothetical protein